MKIVATSDTHFPFDTSNIPDGDVFILAGDMMYTGQVDEWAPRLASLAALPHKRKIFVPGNHDRWVDYHLGAACEELARIGVEVCGVGQPTTYHMEEDGRLTTFLCLPYVTNLPTWAFNRSEEWLKEYMKQFSDMPIDVVISHAPMFGILDATDPEIKNTRERRHVGCRAYRSWFDKKEVKPKVWICGHIHESYGQTNHAGCQVYNVAMCDRDYKQSNKPRVIVV